MQPRWEQSRLPLSSLPTGQRGFIFPMNVTLPTGYGMHSGLPEHRLTSCSEDGKGKSDAPRKKAFSMSYGYPFPPIISNRKNLYLASGMVYYN
jgi:hypothetical protein